MKSALPLVLELAEPKMIAGDVDIQLSGRGGGTQSQAGSNTFSLGGLVSDVAADLVVDDNTVII